MGFGVWGLGFGVWGLGIGVWGLGFGVWGLGVGGLGFGLWLWALGFRVYRVSGLREGDRVSVGGIRVFRLWPKLYGDSRRSFNIPPKAAGF